MKSLFRNQLHFLSQMEQRHVQFILIVITLVLFVLGAGAPESGGGVGLNSVGGPSGW